MTLVFGSYSGSGVLDRSETTEFASWVVTSRRVFLSVGPAAIASIAFLTKFKITCCSRVCSANSLIARTPLFGVDHFRPVGLSIFSTEGPSGLLAR